MTKALEDIEKLVASVAKKAALGQKIPEEQLDALKLLQPYYFVLKKAKGKPDDDLSEGGPTMGTMRERLRVVEQEPADGRVQTSSRRSGDDT